MDSDVVDDVVRFMLRRSRVSALEVLTYPHLVSHDGKDHSSNIVEGFVGA